MKHLKYLVTAAAAVSVFAGQGCSMLSGGRTKAQVQAEPMQKHTVQQVAQVPQPQNHQHTHVYDTPGDSFTPEADNCINCGSPERYDSLIACWHEQNVQFMHDDFFKNFIDIDPMETQYSSIPDSIYKRRMQMLVSPISLGYNDVIKGYIVSYTTRNKGVISRVLGLSKAYFPMIEEELARQGLPLELRMLPVIESALNPVAVSRAGATGLWQFMLATGKAYGLEVTSFIDDRRDPVKSTRAACRYLGDLYRMYDDWTLAIAAYNCGPGNVNKAIKRAGEENVRTFWDIYPYLPRETRGYIPSFVAATYAFNYHKQHGIDYTPAALPISTDTVTINKLTHFSQVSSTLDMPVETLRALNPQYKEDIIPAVEKPYPLTLPQYDVTRYIANEQQIMEKDTIYLAKYINQPAEKIAQEVVASVTRYKIKSGDTLGGIARKHGVTVNQLVKWNNLKNANALIRPGQTLEIHR